MSRIVVSIEKQRNGSLLLSTVEGGRLIKKVYYDYTIAEAKRDFAGHVRSELRKNPCGSKHRNPQDEINDDDYTIQDVGRLSSEYYVKGLGRFKNFKDAIVAIHLDMEKSHYWPNVFYINDHGNVDQIVLTNRGNRISYRTVR